MVNGRRFYGRGMETLVGIREEIAEGEWRFFGPCKEDRVDPTAPRRSVAHGRASCCFQQGAAAERANRRTRPDHKISSTIQRSAKTTAADCRTDRECGGTPSETASRARFRAYHRAGRFARTHFPTPHNAHWFNTFKINPR